MADDEMEKLYELGETLATSADKSQVRRLDEAATSTPLQPRTASSLRVHGELFEPSRKSVESSSDQNREVPHTFIPHTCRIIIGLESSSIQKARR